MWSSDERDNVERNEFFKAALASAEAKPPLLFDQITPELAQALEQYDYVIALYREPQHASGLAAIEIRKIAKETGFMRCNSIPCADRDTAFKLHELCRSPENHAMEPSVVLNGTN